MVPRSRIARIGHGPDQQAPDVAVRVKEPSEHFMSDSPHPRSETTSWIDSRRRRHCGVGSPNDKAGSLYALPKLATGTVFHRGGAGLIRASMNPRHAQQHAAHAQVKAKTGGEGSTQLPEDNSMADKSHAAGARRSPAPGVVDLRQSDSDNSLTRITKQITRASRLSLAIRAGSVKNSLSRSILNLASHEGYCWEDEFELTIVTEKKNVPKGHQSTGCLTEHQLFKLNVTPLDTIGTVTRRIAEANDCLPEYLSLSTIQTYTVVDGALQPNNPGVVKRGGIIPLANKNESLYDAMVDRSDPLLLTSRRALPRRSNLITCRNIFMFLAFTLFVDGLIQFYQNDYGVCRAVTDLIVDDTTSKFSQISDVGDMKTFVDSQLIPAIWNLKDPGTVGETLRLNGYVTVRQHRVDANTHFCTRLEPGEVYHTFKKQKSKHDCIPTFDRHESMSTMPFGTCEKKFEFSNYEPMARVDGSHPEDYTSRGYYTTRYPGSQGYYVNMRSNMSNAEAVETFKNLSDCGFYDARTRAIFVEFSGMTVSGNLAYFGLRLVFLAEPSGRVAAKAIPFGFAYYSAHQAQRYWTLIGGLLLVLFYGMQILESLLVNDSRNFCGRRDPSTGCINNQKHLQFTDESFDVPFEQSLPFEVFCPQFFPRGTYAVSNTENAENLPLLRREKKTSYYHDKEHVTFEVVDTDFGEGPLKVSSADFAHLNCAAAVHLILWEMITRRKLTLVKQLEAQAQPVERNDKSDKKVDVGWVRKHLVYRPEYTELSTIAACLRILSECAHSCSNADELTSLLERDFADGLTIDDLDSVFIGHIGGLVDDEEFDDEDDPTQRKIVLTYKSNNHKWILTPWLHARCEKEALVVHQHDSDCDLALWGKTITAVHWQDDLNGYELMELRPHPIYKNEYIINLVGPDRSCWTAFMNGEFRCTTPETIKHYLESLRVNFNCSFDCNVVKDNCFRGFSCMEDVYRLKVDGSDFDTGDYMSKRDKAVLQENLRCRVADYSCDLYQQSAGSIALYTLRQLHGFTYHDIFPALIGVMMVLMYSLKDSETLGFNLVPSLIYLSLVSYMAYQEFREILNDVKMARFYGHTTAYGFRDHFCSVWNGIEFIMVFVNLTWAVYSMQSTVSTRYVPLDTKPGTTRSGNNPALETTVPNFIIGPQTMDDAWWAAMMPFWHSRARMGKWLMWVSFCQWALMFKYVILVMPSLAIVLETVAASLRQSANFLFALGLFVCMFTVPFTVVFGGQDYNYSSRDRTMFQLFRPLLGDMDFEGLMEIDEQYGSYFYLVYIVILVFVLLNIFVAIMSNAYEAANSIITARIELNVKRGFEGTANNISLPVLKWLTLLPLLSVESRAEKRRDKKKEKRLKQRAMSVSSRKSPTTQRRESQVEARGSSNKVSPAAPSSRDLSALPPIDRRSGSQNFGGVSPTGEDI